MWPRDMKSILYVDDEPTIRELVQMSIELHAGLEIRCVENGELALQELDKRLPDLLLLDNMLPGMDGPAILEAAWSRVPSADLPVVFLTAKALPAEVARLKELGAADVIAKPFDPERLAEQLLEIWRRIQKSD